VGFLRDRDAAVANLWPERAATFLERTRADADVLRGNLTQLLMAQGYQDITGQIIRSVISLVDELEQVLGKLVRLPKATKSRASCVRCGPSRSWERGLGPQVRGLESATPCPARTTSTRCCRRWRRASSASWTS
jgi:chemotaxis regulatin CheY-phosphate phosphatase CheZ